MWNLYCTSNPDLARLTFRRARASTAMEQATLWRCRFFQNMELQYSWEFCYTKCIFSSETI